MTGLQNIEFPLKVRKCRAGAAPQGAGHCRAAGHRRAARPQARQDQRRPASAGSLARALVRSPHAFLMDEPLSNLDASLRASMRAEIKQLVSALGITTVYVTHDQIEAMSMADRIGVMSGGEMVQIGRPLHVYDNPRTRFVAEFLGSPPMNLFPAELGASGGWSRSRRLSPTCCRPSSAEMAANLAARGRGFFVGVRPEHLSLAARMSRMPFPRWWSSSSRSGRRRACICRGSRRGSCWSPAVRT